MGSSRLSSPAQGTPHDHLEGAPTMQWEHFTQQANGINIHYVAAG